ncbi:MAG: UDP-N-acetylmuramate--L-alanine ligase, partial [Candidatus Nealsonbacteria bacterium]|nr:UDP-N-acetylmuramate--L-alanine ligase [Candidatus Nealsonbacteria bacterium]
MKVHFLGIGGIGVSALAHYYLAQGHQVSGSDLTASEITDALKKKGVKILIGKENPENISRKYDLVIHSPAVTVRNPASNVLSYPEALGRLTKKYFTIAVSGTHGKSTTTAMIGLLLVKAGLDPTVIVGTKIKEFGDSNCRIGKSRYLVIEADEHMASFLNYWPKIIVLTTIEEDHLDYYKNLNNILKTFKKYVGRLPKNGKLVANKDDKNIRKVVGQTSKLSYSLRQPEAKKLKKA